MMLLLLGKFYLQSLTEIIDLFLACQEDKDTSRRELIVNLTNFVESRLTVVCLRYFAEMCSYRILPRRHLDYIRLS